MSISPLSRSATRVMPSGGAKSPRWTESGPSSAAIIRTTEITTTAVSTATLMNRWNRLSRMPAARLRPVAKSGSSTGRGTSAFT